MPQSAVQLGKQATPSASKAKPATRATGLATPARSAPNNNLPTNDGTIINATPVAASATAAIVNTFFTALVFQDGVAMRIDKKTKRARVRMFRAFHLQPIWHL